ncbi:hypothetical protein HUU05_07750 [candidate division KSB1 bacterium]|nr:hypothetical protein [candidate division KSB1 bacterium]
MPAQTIAEVIAALDAIIADAIAQRSRLGFFAVLYREVTVQVQAGIASNRFEDGARMERLDVMFANRYLEAYENFQQGMPASACWEAAFKAAPAWRPLILQHLLFGMNAHINLDLGIAAAQTAPGMALPALEKDFKEINSILSSLLDQVQAKIGKLSPWLAWLDFVGKRLDEAVFNFSLKIARREAWKVAERFAALTPEDHAQAISVLDGKVAKLAQKILSPGWLFSGVAFLIKLRESDDVPRIIEVLRA